jgi:hypothetical protein
MQPVGALVTPPDLPPPASVFTQQGLALRRSRAVTSTQARRMLVVKPGLHLLVVLGVGNWIS